MNAINKASKPDRPTWRKRLREFRFLAVVLGVWMALGLYEMNRSDLPKSPSDVVPQWLLDERVNMAQTLLELYPQRSLGHFLRSYQAGMCFDVGYRLPVCDQFQYRDPRDAQAALEAAIALHGLSNQEELYHFYATILVRNGARADQVDQAIANWRRNYPYSTKKPDPR